MPSVRVMSKPYPALKSPWWYGTDPEPVRGTRVWRAYFRDRPSFTFGIHVGWSADDATNVAAQWGDVISVEPVT